MYEFNAVALQWCAQNKGGAQDNALVSYLFLNHILMYFGLYLNKTMVFASYTKLTEIALFTLRSMLYRHRRAIGHTAPLEWRRRPEGILQ